MSKVTRRFAISQFNQQINTHIEYVSPEVPDDAQRSGRISFDLICEKFKEQTDAEFAKKVNESRTSIKTANKDKVDEADEFLSMENSAIIGVTETVTTIMEYIQTFINNTGAHDVYIPEYYKDLQLYARLEQQKYSNLTHAMFHEIYGFNMLAAWQKFPDSYAAQIIGTNIWIHSAGKHQLMKFKFKSVQQVEKIIRSLTRQKDDAVVNIYNTTLEIDLYTGERVTLTVKPDVKHDVITIRRFLIGRITVADLADENKGTIPVESVPLYKALSKTHCNILVVGPPGTGKSTSLKALLSERENFYTGAIIEKHYELAAGRDNPEKKIIERIANEETFARAFDQILRFDTDYCVIGEIRRIEVEGAMLACERLLNGFLSTFHTWLRTETIPSQLARLICNLNPNANVKMEERRVAENIDIIILQCQDEGKRKKRFKSVQELRYNPENGEISTHEIMRWNSQTDAWSYRADLSSTLIEKMNEISPDWTQVAIDTLKGLEKKSPIEKEKGVVIYNPASADPSYRMAIALENLCELVGGIVNREGILSAFAMAAAARDKGGQ